MPGEARGDSDHTAKKNIEKLSIIFIYSTFYKLTAGEKTGK
jgi:hypothetical protein